MTRKRFCVGFAVAVLIGCASHPKSSAPAIDVNDAIAIARRSVSDHGVTDATIARTRFLAGREGKGWQVAVLFPSAPGESIDHVVVHIDSHGQVTRYASD